MNQLFAGQLGEYVCVYLDDILIFSKNAAEHEEHLKEVLKMLEQNRFYAKLSKCDFIRSELLYLGHIDGAYGIRVDPAKIAAVSSGPCLRICMRCAVSWGSLVISGSLCKDMQRAAVPSQT